MNKIDPRPGCSARIFAGHTDYPCSRNGNVEEDGKWWCRQHAPSTAQRKQMENDRRDRRESEALASIVEQGERRVAELNAATGLRFKARTIWRWRAGYVGVEIILPDETILIDR